MPHVTLMLMLSQNCNREAEKMQERLLEDGRYLCLMAVILALETLRLSMLDLKDAINAPLPLSHPIFLICHGNVFSATQALIIIPTIVVLLPFSATFTVYSLLWPHFFNSPRNRSKRLLWESEWWRLGQWQPFCWTLSRSPTEGKSNPFRSSFCRIILMYNRLRSHLHPSRLACREQEIHYVGAAHDCLRDKCVHIKLPWGLRWSVMSRTRALRSLCIMQDCFAVKASMTHAIYRSRQNKGGSSQGSTSIRQTYTIRVDRESS